MTSPQISAAYQQLLIALAKDAEDLKQKVTLMHIALKTEQNEGKCKGMRTIINARNRQRARLLQLLGRNKTGLRYFGINLH